MSEETDEQHLERLRQIEARGRLLHRLLFWVPFTIAIGCLLGLTWEMGIEAGRVRGMSECLGQLQPQIDKLKR